MDSKPLPDLIKSQYELFTHFWHKKQRGEDLNWYSFNLSDGFERVVEIDEIDRSELYANGRVIFKDRQFGLNFEIGVSGELEKLKAGMDVPFEDIVNDDKSRQNRPQGKYTDLMLFFNGDVHLEDSSKIITGTFVHGKPRGYFYHHEKNNDITDVLNLKFGDICATWRESYNAQGIRDGIERHEDYQKGQGVSKKFENGKDTGEINHYRCSALPEKTILQKLYVVAYVLGGKHRSHDLNAIAMAMIAKDKAEKNR